MTPDEFAKKMKEIESRYNGDPDVMHSCMDTLMCNLLHELGYKDGVSVFIKADKWYA